MDAGTPDSRREAYLKDHEVSWQAAWWALIPLALTAMLQPVGAVLGRKEKAFRFYVRVSPIICAVDTAQVLLKLLVCLVSRGNRARNVRDLLRKRFENEDAVRETTNPENSRLWRLVLLGISGVGCQTGKLLFMSNIPVTKMWVGMYLTSIIVGEVMIFAARSLQKAETPIHAPPPQARGLGQLDTSVNDATMKWGLSETFQQGFFSSSTLDLHVFAVCLTASNSVLSLLAAAGTRWIILAVGISALVSSVAAWAISRLGLDFLTGRAAFVTSATIVLIIAPWAKSNDTFLNPWMDMLGQLKNFCRVLPGFLYFFEAALGTLLYFFCGCLIAFAVHVVSISLMFFPAIFRQSRRIAGEESYAEYMAPGVCVSTFVVSGIGYKFLFNPEGTFNPDWTKVFG